MSEGEIQSVSKKEEGRAPRDDLELLLWNYEAQLEEISLNNVFTLKCILSLHLNHHGGH